VVHKEMQDFMEILLSYEIHRIHHVGASVLLKSFGRLNPPLQLVRWTRLLLNPRSEYLALMNLTVIAVSSLGA